MNEVEMRQDAAERRGARFHRLGPAWVEIGLAQVRGGIGRAGFRIQDLRRRPWSTLFSDRNGRHRSVTLLAGRWMVRVEVRP
jgi:hypothetical protein